MPPELPISPETDDSLEDELVRWATEFQVRPGNYNPEFDGDDSIAIVRSIAEEGSLEENIDLVEEVDERIQEIRSQTHDTDRLPMLHVSRENMSEVERIGGLPEGFLDDLHEVAAEYIDGFMPGQKITPPSSTEFTDTDKNYAGSHSFRRDRSSLYHTFGGISEGSPAAEAAAHETMHKNNVEALIGEVDRVRDLATVYENDVPEEYEELIENTEVPSVKHDLLGGLSLLVLDEIYNAGILSAYQENSREDIDFTQYIEEFENAAEVMNEKFGLEEYDTRDETICQAVSYFMKGQFEEGFEKELADTRSSYNSLDHYGEKAGDIIASHLNGFRKEMEQAEGLRGQRFKQVMQNRIPFLKGEYEFGK
ncbi:hypothetical protein GKQ38_01640 [Candidatus Nanohaloarchaea archaeon]|nr:hypothetical protein GKQ38_01640 [Candidatus Nanohaloarchaea archaeon]